MRKIILVIISVAILIQFVPVPRENPLSVPENEISVDAQTKSILERSCYNCHSNKTEWPAYSYVAPVSWFIVNHVSEGRKELNFSEWHNYSEKRKNKKIEEITEEINEDKMPLSSYLLLHSEAELSQEEKQIIKDGIKALSMTHQIQRD